MFSATTKHLCAIKSESVKCQTSLKSCVVRKELVAGGWHRVAATTQHLHQLTECAEEGLIEAFSLLVCCRVISASRRLASSIISKRWSQHSSILSNHSCCLSSAACISARAATTSCCPLFLLPGKQNRQDCWLFSKAFFTFVIGVSHADV